MRPRAAVELDASFEPPGYQLGTNLAVHLSRRSRNKWADLCAASRHVPGALTTPAVRRCTAILLPTRLGAAIWFAAPCDRALLSKSASMSEDPACAAAAVGDLSRWHRGLGSEPTTSFLAERLRRRARSPRLARSSAHSSARRRTYRRRRHARSRCRRAEPSLSNALTASASRACCWSTSVSIEAGIDRPCPAAADRTSAKELPCESVVQARARRLRRDVLSDCSRSRPLQGAPT